MQMIVLKFLVYIRVPAERLALHVPLLTPVVIRRFLADEANEELYRGLARDILIKLTPPVLMTLEQSISFLAADELLEVTPGSLRLRKLYLKEHERKRHARGADA